MIAVHNVWVDKGIGKALMAAMVDLADKWMHLTRLGLTVWKSNVSVIRLCGSFGFKTEGTMPD